MPRNVRVVNNNGTIRVNNTRGYAERRGSTGRRSSIDPKPERDRFDPNDIDWDFVEQARMPKNQPDL